MRTRILALVSLLGMLLFVSTAQAGEHIYYFHNDHLGTPQTMTDQAGTVVWAAEYEPFGKATLTTSTITNNLRFPGQYYDAETGLHYNYHRDYQPETGRYLQPDPIGLAGGLNLYNYVDATPLSRLDPLGLDWLYSQSTGQLSHVDVQTGVSQLVGTGYAGHNRGLNNPANQSVRGGGPNSNAGPLPQGTYSIGPQRTNITATGVALPGSMRLLPSHGNTMYGRRGFLIHGGDMTDRASSQGCIVLRPAVRNIVGSSDDRVLRVVP